MGGSRVTCLPESSWLCLSHSASCYCPLPAVIISNLWQQYSASPPPTPIHSPLQSQSHLSKLKSTVYPPPASSSSLTRPAPKACQVQGCGVSPQAPPTPPQPLHPLPARQKILSGPTASLPPASGQRPSPQEASGPDWARGQQFQDESSRPPWGETRGLQPQ